jgi:quinolinate synthase
MKSSIIEKINVLKKSKNAIILAHNYQLPEIQDTADFVGDSLELSVKASKTTSDIIVFCGVHFMAETASILSPHKKVIIPDLEAGCPMADMINARDVINKKKKHTDAIAVCYVNTTAEVKAECDYAVTSANAVDIISKLKHHKNIIFLPDKNLGSFVTEKTGKEMILMDGYCPTHAKITAGEILNRKKEHPGALVVSHPECESEVRNISDIVASTSQMCKFIRESNCREFIMATEEGLNHRLKKENPDKNFYPASVYGVCPNMKKNTLEKLLWTLEDEKNEVKVPENIRARALKCVENMINLST